MIGQHAVLAVVPARSGSRGVPNKNMRVVRGLTLIARAAQTLRLCATVDASIISTDSEAYAEEGRRHGLDAWFLRPTALSTDTASAADTVIHALLEAETHYRRTFDVVLIIEPTSPLRRPEDVDACAKLLLDSDADSVVSVSRLDPKYHPAKLLRVNAGKLQYYDSAGAGIVARQQLDSQLCYRNGVCYALRRSFLTSRKQIIGEHTVPFVIDRPLVNIDEPLEVDLAEFLLAREP